MAADGSWNVNIGKKICLGYVLEQSLDSFSNLLNHLMMITRLDKLKSLESTQSSCFKVPSRCVCLDLSPSMSRQFEGNMGLMFVFISVEALLFVYIGSIWLNGYCKSMSCLVISELLCSVLCYLSVFCHEKWIEQMPMPLQSRNLVNIRLVKYSVGDQLISS